jgi:manganese-dependent ADP-ribose/CDP-alcohol diphosphatase
VVASVEIARFTFLRSISDSIHSQYTMASTTNTTTKPLFSFGVITDVQYADINDGKSFHGISRYYRNSIKLLEEAINSWNNDHQLPLAFTIHLGDIVDGWAEKPRAKEGLETVIDVFNKFKGPVYHLIGNHCLYNLKRDVLHPMLNIDRPPDQAAYYDFSPHPKYRLVVVDTYDISTLGFPDGHPNHEEATNILKNKNPNKDKNSPEGLIDHDRRFVSFNGGLSTPQLQWLKSVLEDAQKKDQHVILFSHVPLHPYAGDPLTTAWNFEEITELLTQYPVVKMVLSGHDHDGGYWFDEQLKLHHLVFPGIIETPPHTNAFGTIHVHEDGIDLQGVGRVETRTYKWGKPIW